MKNTYKIIAKFKYEDDSYFIALTDTNRILYAVYKNNQISLKLSQKELSIFNAVYSALKIDTKDSLNLGSVNLKGKDFEIFYDPNIKLFYWYEIVNNQRLPATVKDNIRLNSVLNHIPTSVFKDDEQNNKMKNGNAFIRRIVNFHKKNIAVINHFMIKLIIITRI